MELNPRASSSLGRTPIRPWVISFPLGRGISVFLGPPPLELPTFSFSEAAQQLDTSQRSTAFLALVTKRSQKGAQHLALAAHWPLIAAVSDLAAKYQSCLR